jgi:tripartite-type tricarboxylate transporter receptor subunit TctC
MLAAARRARADRRVAAPAEIREQPMRSLLIASACALAFANVGSGRADVYPSRPIMLVVPLPAGFTFDLTARLLAEHMRASLGQPVIVENVTGASGSIGVGRVARAAPDGYVLCFGGLNTHVLNAAVLTLPYDVVTDFAPIALVATAPLVIVTNKAVAANDLTQLIAWLKANPGKASQGTGGPGSLTHFAGVYFQQRTGTRFGAIPYRGGGAAINDLMAGTIDLLIDLAPNSLPHLRAGAIKAYAVLAKTRLPAAPGIPTVDEAGLPGLHVSAWQAIWAPKGTPPAVIAKLNGAIVEALADPALRARLADLGEDVFPPEQRTPAALAAWQKAEIEKWWPVAKALKGEAQ